MHLSYDIIGNCLLPYLIGDSSYDHVLSLMDDHTRKHMRRVSIKVLITDNACTDDEFKSSELPFTDEENLFFIRNFSKFASHAVSDYGKSDRKLDREVLTECIQKGYTTMYKYLVGNCMICEDYIDEICAHSRVEIFAYHCEGFGYRYKYLVLIAYNACYDGHLVAIEKLCELYPEDMRKAIMDNRVIDGGTYPFNVACFFGHVDIVKYLLAWGINPAAYDHGISSLASAFECNYLAIAHLLMPLFPDMKREEYMDMLVNACKQDNLAVVQLLIEAKVDITREALPLAYACQEESYNVMHYLIKNGAYRFSISPACTDVKNADAFHEINTQIIAAIDMPEESGKLPITIKDDKEAHAFRALLDYQAGRECKSCCSSRVVFTELLRQACCHGYLSTIKYFLEGDEKSTILEDKEELLSFSVYGNQKEVYEYLLDVGDYTIHNLLNVLSGFIVGYRKCSNAPKKLCPLHSRMRKRANYCVPLLGETAQSLLALCNCLDRPYLLQKVTSSDTPLIEEMKQLVNCTYPQLVLHRIENRKIVYTSEGVCCICKQTHHSKEVIVKEKNEKIIATCWRYGRNAFSRDNYIVLRDISDSSSDELDYSHIEICIRENSKRKIYFHHTMEVNRE